MSTVFAILRTAKLKTLGNVGGSLAHTYRTRETPNADASKAQDNTNSHAQPAEVLRAIHERLPEKRRKDAVLCVEYFIGASPAWFEHKSSSQQDAYFQDAVRWLEHRHGKANLMGWSIHRDESTPHLVAYVVPLDDTSGRLNAKAFTGGKAILSKMQSDFAQQVGVPHGLERGIEGSKAKHQTIRSFYGQLEQPVEHFVIPPGEVRAKVLRKGFFTSQHESPEMVAERLTRAVQRFYGPSLDSAKVARSERQRAAQMALTAKAKQAEKAVLQGRVNDLVRELQPVMELATRSRQEFYAIIQDAKQRLDRINNKNPEKLIKNTSDKYIDI